MLRHKSTVFSLIHKDVLYTLSVSCSIVQKWSQHFPQVFSPTKYRGGYFKNMCIGLKPDSTMSFIWNCVLIGFFTSGHRIAALIIIVLTICYLFYFCIYVFKNIMLFWAVITAESRGRSLLNIQHIRLLHNIQLFEDLFQHEGQWHSE